MSGELFKWDSGQGASNVEGPSSATNGNFAIFDGATGKKIKDSGTQAANRVLAGPTSGANATPTFRGLEVGDLPTGVTVRVTRSTAQSHTTSGTWQVLSWESAAWDKYPSGLSAHWAVGTPTRLTCRVAGIYLLTEVIAFSSNATGLRGVTIRKNGTDYFGGVFTAAVNGQQTIFQASAQVSLAENDYIEMQAYQTSGGALNMDIVSGAPSLAMTYLSR